MDSLSPIAPARVRALLLPIGRIKRARFRAFVERLRPHNVVRLGDVSPDGRPNRNMFSPLASPTGLVIYDLSISLPSESQVALAPFECFRETPVIVGVADSLELVNVMSSQHSVHNPEMRGSHGADGRGADDCTQLAEQFEKVRGEFPGALAYRLLLFDHPVSRSGKHLPDNIIAVPPLAQVKITTMKTIMCDLTSLLLAEMTTFAKSIQGLPTIESPRTAENRPLSNGLSGYNGAQEPSSRSSVQAYASEVEMQRASSIRAEERSKHRMSMPVRLSSASNLENNSEAGSDPDRSISRPSTPPPSTFDATSRSPSKSPLANAIIRSGTSREPSRDRISVHGFGSGSLSERARNKGKGRVALVIGSLYLQAGRWSDAVKELVESASIAKSNSDHLWHAKALENILVGLLMLAWGGMDFQIPMICYPIAEKSNTTSSGKETPLPDFSHLNASSTPTRAVSLKNLASLLPDLLNTILNLYTRASNISGESLPQIAFSETCIRFAKLLTAVHLAGGQLDDSALQLVVHDTCPSNLIKLGLPRTMISPSRIEIANMLFRGFPPQTTVSGRSATDRILILTGIASVLARLGLHRKRAFVMSEMITTLIPGLVQSRNFSAAELGVYPIAGLAGLIAANGVITGAGLGETAGEDWDSGLEALLDTLGRVYGVVSSPSKRARASREEIPEDFKSLESHAESDKVILARICHDSALRNFGSQSLKLNILRSSINLCEALPSFEGVLRYSADLLRTAGSGIAPRSDSDDGATNMSREEQIQLTTNISRTVSAAGKLGFKDVVADYWDEFLVRGIESMAGPMWKRLIMHAPGDLEAAGVTKETKSEMGPFIYNPFNRVMAQAVTEQLLVVGEIADFRVTLQNPYEFELELERIGLESEEGGFESIQQSTMIGPYCTKMLSVSGIPTKPGSLTITGCIVKIRNCRERRFPIFTEAWSPALSSKIKSSGLTAVLQPSLSRISTASTTATEALTTFSAPRISRLTLKVIPEQPVVVVKTTSLTQSAMMLIEGETKIFTITLQNLSASTVVDLLLFSSNDSTAKSLQVAMANKDTGPAELYDLEVEVAQKGAFRWRRRPDNMETTIGPGQTKIVSIEVLGRPGLTDGTVQFDYAHLGVPQKAIAETFYTRKVIIPVTITVHASVELARIDCLPVHTSHSSGQSPRRKSRESTDDDTREKFSSEIEPNFFSSPHPFHELLHKLKSLGTWREYSLVLLDLRNVWRSALRIHLQLRHPPLTSATTSSSPQSLPLPADCAASQSTATVYALDELIPAGQTTRLLLPFPRLHLPNPHAPIPTLNPSNRRQFILGASKLSPEAELANREAFWFREAVLKLLHATWSLSTPSGHITGAIDLRKMKLSARMVDTIRVEDISLRIHIQSQNAVKQVTSTTFAIPTSTFLTLRTTVLNRTTKPIALLLRLQPTLRNQPPTIALDVTRKILWHGTLQRTIPIIQPGQSANVDLGLCVLCSGEFEIGGVVEELRPSAHTEDMQTAGGKQVQPTRRTWGVRENCILIAHDNVDVDDEDNDDEDDDDDDSCENNNAPDVT